MIGPLAFRASLLNRNFANWGPLVLSKKEPHDYAHPSKHDSGRVGSRKREITGRNCCFGSGTAHKKGCHSASVPSRAARLKLEHHIR